MSDVSTVNADTTLADLGLDSLMGVEVKQTLERDWDLVLAIRDIRQLTVNKLRAIATGGATGSKSEKAAEDGIKEKAATKLDIETVLPSEKVVKLAEGEGTPVFMVHPVEGMWQ